MHYIGRRASETNPLRSMPFVQSAERVYGPSRDTLVRHALHNATCTVDILRGRYVHAVATLAEANRLPVAWSMKPGRRAFRPLGVPVGKGCRRHYQAEALRRLNTLRAQLRTAERALAAARADAATLTIADRAPLQLLATAPFALAA